MKFLIVHLDTFERFVLLTAVIRELKTKFVDSEIDLILSEEYSDKYLGYVNSCFFFPKSFLKQFKFIRSLSHYDVFIDVQRTEFKDFRRFVPFIKADKKIGYNKPGKMKPFNLPLTKTKEKHLLDYYYKVFDSLKIERPGRCISLDFEDDAEVRFVNDVKSVFIYVSDNGWDEKLWFQLITNHNLSMFKIIMMIPESKSSLKQIINAKLNHIKLIEQYDLGIAIKVLEYADYAVSDDHLIKYFVSKRNLPIVQLAASSLGELEYPLCEEYYVVKPKIQNAEINQVSFDSVLLAFREMTVKF